MYIGRELLNRQIVLCLLEPFFSVVVVVVDVLVLLFVAGIGVFSSLSSRQCFIRPFVAGALLLKDYRQSTLHSSSWRCDKIRTFTYINTSHSSLKCVVSCEFFVWLFRFRQTTTGLSTNDRNKLKNNKML